MGRTFRFSFCRLFRLVCLLVTALLPRAPYHPVMWCARGGIMYDLNWHVARWSDRGSFALARPFRKSVWIGSVVVWCGMFRRLLRFRFRESFLTVHTTVASHAQWLGFGVEGSVHRRIQYLACFVYMSIMFCFLRRRMITIIMFVGLCCYYKCDSSGLRFRARFTGLVFPCRIAM